MNQGVVRQEILIGIVGFVVMCVLGPAVIQHDEMTPITLQTLVLFFFAILGGAKVGAMVAIGYVICAFLGLPVGAGYSVVKGYLHLGFFFGFIIAAIMVGSLSSAAFFRKSWTQTLLWLMGHAIVLCIGLIGMTRFNPDAWQQMEYLMPGALVKSALGALLVQAFRKLMEAREKKSIQL
jgi:biotin transporter BioY